MTGDSATNTAVAVTTAPGAAALFARVAVIVEREGRLLRVGRWVPTLEGEWLETSDLADLSASKEAMQIPRCTLRAGTTWAAWVLAAAVDGGRVWRDFPADHVLHQFPRGDGANIYLLDERNGPWIRAKWAEEARTSAIQARGRGDHAEALRWASFLVQVVPTLSPADAGMQLGALRLAGQVERARGLMLMYRGNYGEPFERGLQDEVRRWEPASRRSSPWAEEAKAYMLRAA
jgi:hypothetical protein